MTDVPPSGKSTRQSAGRPLNRTEIAKSLWAYIKKNGLQDSNRRRVIFDSPVALRNLGVRDIRRMVSDPKIKIELG